MLITNFAAFDKVDFLSYAYFLRRTCLIPDNTFVIVKENSNFSESLFIDSYFLFFCGRWNANAAMELLCSEVTRVLVWEICNIFKKHVNILHEILFNIILPESSQLEWWSNRMNGRYVSGV